MWTLHNQYVDGFNTANMQKIYVYLKIIAGRNFFGNKQIFFPNSGGQAQIKECTEVAFYTPILFCKNYFRNKIINYVKIAGFLSIGSIYRPTFELYNFSVNYYFFVCKL